jgi:hypothetical protein
MKAGRIVSPVPSITSAFLGIRASAYAAQTFGPSMTTFPRDMILGPK